VALTWIAASTKSMFACFYSTL